MNQLELYLNYQKTPASPPSLITQFMNSSPSLDKELETTPPALMTSPPELLHDSGEEESDDEGLHDRSPYFSSLPVLMHRESSIRSNSKPTGAFEDNTIQNRSHEILRQNHLPAVLNHHQHRTKLSPSLYDFPNNRRKSVPHRSPAAIHDALQATALDQSIVFQLNVSPDIVVDESLLDSNDNIVKPKVICGESLLTALRRRVTSARHERNSSKSKTTSPRHRPMVVAQKIHIPRSPKPTKRRKSPEAVSPSELANAFTDMSVYHDDEKLHRRSHAFDYRSQLDFSEDDEPSVEPMDIESGSEKKAEKSASPRSKSKGPCQACQELSDGCMRKGFNWPFEASLIYYDKGKPFVYLCNKCGLRYNKSNGCVCRNCRWVFCKEEKRKALQHIERMRSSRLNGKLDMDEYIEGFVCSPKYWTCGQKWRVGWVLNANANE